MAKEMHAESISSACIFWHIRMYGWETDIKMIRDERINRMKAYINTQQYVSMTELMSKFNISKATVRRDLEMLAQENEICLLRGGARKKDDVNRELMYSEKLGRNREEKKRISQCAAEMIQEGQTVFIDTGVTTREMIPYLCSLRNVHVVTNDVWIAAHITTNTDIKVSVPGGNIRRGYYTIKGHEAEQFLSKLYVDIAFVSIDAIDRKFGCSITNNDEVNIKQKVISNSSKAVILADHSKFGTVASWKVCEIEDIDLYITGTELSKEEVEYYKKMNIPVRTV